MESAQWDFIKGTLDGLKADQVYLRDKVDKLDEKNDDEHKKLGEKINGIQVGFEGHKTKLTLLLTGVAAAISLGVSYIFDRFTTGS